MEDSSLDDFLDDSEGSEGPPTGDEDGGAESGNGESPTSRWSPEGTACAVCGESTTRLWHDGGKLVCGSCKDWA
jgi:hypothetical protein